MNFEIIGDIYDIETIATGTGIRDRDRLQREYGKGKWRKLKGNAMIQLENGNFDWQNCIGIRRMASDERRLNVSATWIRTMKTVENIGVQFAVCVNNADYPASLELHKIYRVLPDATANADGDIRVIDESGEDYLYPAAYFVAIELPQELKQALLQVGR